jgi:HAD superfamily hydrolase (TIGR01509 family)
MSQIKNIIFDLGGVIINLDINKSIQEFNKLSKKPFETIYTQLQQSPIFDNFDKGEISETEFFNEIQKALGTQIPKEKLLFAWNAMLLDFPKHRLQLLKNLKQNYRLFLLSNTNETHIAEFERSLFKQHGYKNLESFFETVYYSCRMGKRKPNREIFDFVINKHLLDPHETLFIDDSPQHIEGASKLGIQAKFLSKDRDVEDLIIELGLI